ncbi:phosphatidate cytidylyltransferase [Enterovirga aerilata]|uniref:Phosphatidate cytidylyltransferase n=1 Tax=Enterovirga aerilata TaxID=2730920 RepID=A0A849HY90_9HYPH|nr:phosphatidate cytidylyltransferase [Enterovirga sp. DB1703]
MSDPGRSGGQTRTSPTRSEVGRRVASGIVLAAVALAAAWLGGPVFALFWLAAGIAIAFEWIAMTRAEPRAILAALCAAGLAGLIVGHKLDTSPAAEAGILLLALGALAFAAESGRDRAWALAGFAYAALVALVPVVIRDRPDLGLVPILWLFAVVWTTDVAAYFAGRAIGGPKLAPSVSPKKTWSGFLGGLAGATLVGTLVVDLGRRFGAELPVGLVAVALGSAVASVASQIGDLGESALKRRFGAKDSGRLIPGHGGVMDRLDGFAAVALLCGVALAGSRLAR